MFLVVSKFACKYSVLFCTSIALGVIYLYTIIRPWELLAVQKTPLFAGWKPYERL